ncbi:efflux RND transporter periplasmic adaptor subunit [Desulfobulbus rhabdoformis]|uniref:efflux RND transporter periplasmic adaptor subunit n=1 Tax=Desulfobulbus rhabdoformis TaxID=34032 RepID=UPI0023DCF57C|nr:efflux RND transporter periplasmic adaptor subunit [Desulfobulbus rhabdoformis]
MKIYCYIIIALLCTPLWAFAEKVATPVFVTDVAMHNFVEEIEALGTLKAKENVDLTASVTERITHISFESGQRVHKGDLLVEMDIAQEQALLAEERSVAQKARRQVQRLGPLIARGAASQLTMDEAQLDLHTAQARIAAIEAQINERRILAPFDGKLGLRNVSVGLMAQPGTLITTIDDDSLMKLDFAVPEIFLPAIHEGGKITAFARAFPGHLFTGTVKSIDSRVDPVSRAILVRALLDNADHFLRPGMLMRVKLQKKARQVLLVPEESLVARGDKKYVFVVTGEKGQKTVSFVLVTIGTRRGGEAEVLDGLQPGMQIVTHGIQRLQDGDPVVVRALDNGNSTLDEMLQQKARSGE